MVQDSNNPFADLIPSGQKENPFSDLIPGDQAVSDSGVLRQAGLTARHALAGPAKLATGINDAFTMALDEGLRLLGSDFRLGQATPMVDDALDAIGLPSPEGRTEEVVGTASEFLSGAGGPIRVGQSLASNASRVPAAVGEVLSSNPLNQAISAVTGALGLEGAREAELGPAGQFGVTTAASLTPSAVQFAVPSLVRSGFRGSDPTAMRENIATFEGAGTQPSVGQATQNRRAQAAESLLSKTPGGAGRMASTAERQADDVGQYVEDTVNQVAIKSTPERAGIEVERGIAGDGGFVSRFVSKAEDLYNRVDQFINPESPIELTNTRRLFETPSAMAESAPNTAGMLRSNFIEKLGLAIDDDIAAYVSQNGFEGLPYAAVKQIRTAVGERLKNLTLVEDVSKGELKRLYGALSEDLTEAARRNGADAFAAAKRADKFWRAGRERIDMIERVINKNGGPEKIFSSLMSGTKDGATVLRTVMKSLKPDERKWVASAVIRRMGRATPGQQDAGGERFSLSTYLTNWNRLSPEAKGTLLSGQDPMLVKATDHVASVAENVRDWSRVFANPSGTQPAVSLQAVGVGGGVSALMGNIPVTLLIAGIPITANLGARLMTNPNFVNWLARTTQMPQGAVPVAINEFSQMAAHYGDPELQEFAALLNQQVDN